MTIEEVRQQIGEYVDVMPTDEFLRRVGRGLFTDYDGVGFFHDGEHETDIQVRCNVNYLSKYVGAFPYVCWYNK